LSGREPCSSSKTRAFFLQQRVQIFPALQQTFNVQRSTSNSELDIAIRSFVLLAKTVSTQRRNQHARRARYPATKNKLAVCAPQPDHAKKRSGVSRGCGLQMRATQCSQVSCPLRISISTRKKKIGTSVFASKGNRTASFSVVTTISRSRRIHRLMKLCSSASV